MAAIVKPIYPNVPDVDGVPSLFRRASAVVNTVSLLVADAMFLSDAFGVRQWDLLDPAGESVFGPAVDSVLGVSYRRSFNVPDYPVEGGQFANYNKVNTPYQVRLELTMTGETYEIESFLTVLESMAESLDLYTVQFPGGIIEDMNVTSVDYQRNETTGPQRISPIIYLQQIRIAGDAAFTNSQAPSGAPTTNSGTVQPKEPTTSQAAAGTIAT